MESKLNRQKNVTNTLSKPKQYSEPKKNTWGNLLQRKPVCTSTKTTSDIKKQKNKGVQCMSTISEGCQSSNSLSIFNPIRTLQFLLKEISHLPKSQNPDLTSIVHDMQIVVERIVDEYSELTNQSSNKLNELSVIPTKGDNFLENLNDKNKDKINSTLVNKITHLENKNALLTEQLKSAEEKLLNVTSERDALIRKLKDNGNLIEKLNEREREYLDTICSLKTKLMEMEKKTFSREIAVKELTKRLMISSKINENNKKSCFKELKDDDLIVLPKEDKSKSKNTKLHQYLTSQEWSRTFSEPEQYMFDNENKQNSVNKITTTDITSSSNLLHQFEKQCEENIEKSIDLQFNEYNQESKNFISKKFELENMFKNMKADLSQQMFELTKLNNEIKLDDILDEDDNISDVSQFQSVKTHSFIN